MSIQRRAVGLRYHDGSRTRRAKARDCELRQARQAVGRGVLPAVTDEAEEAARYV